MLSAVYNLLVNRLLAIFFLTYSRLRYSELFFLHGHSEQLGGDGENLITGKPWYGITSLTADHSFERQYFLVSVGSDFVT